MVSRPSRFTNIASCYVANNEKRKKVKAGMYYMAVDVAVILHNLGVPSKFKGCVPKVADRYTPPLAPVIGANIAYAHA